MRDIFYLKFLDELVLPGIILIAVRYLGFFAASYLRPIQFSFGSTSDLASAPFLDFSSPDHFLFANSISWLFVTGALTLLFGFILFRNYHFREDWIHPRVASYLHNKHLEQLIVERKEAFYQAASWLFFTATSLAFITIEFLAGQLSVLIFGAASGAGFSLVLLFFLELAQGQKLKGKKV